VGSPGSSPVTAYVPEKRKKNYTNNLVVTTSTAGTNIILPSST